MEIKIGKSSHACQACGGAFAHEQPLTSTAVITDEGLIREDYCRACWDEDSPPTTFSAWSAQFYDPAVAEGEPPEVFSPLRQTFYESVEEKGRKAMALAYLSAQLLRRQKVFRLIKETQNPDDDARLALFADRIGNRLIEVNDENLSHAELDEGRRLLMEKLDLLENPEPEEGTPENGESEDQSP